MGTIKTAYSPDDRRFVVYIHETPSGKRYVGITGRQLSLRWGNGKHYQDCPAMNAAIQKYGWQNIQHHIVSVGLTQQEAERTERYLVEKYKTTDREYGYNVLPGGDIGNGISEEGKRKIIESHKGRKRSIDTREKIKNSLVNNGHTKKVVCYETGEAFESAAEAGRKLGFNGKLIFQALNKPDKTCAGKHWVEEKFLENFAPEPLYRDTQKKAVIVIETGDRFQSVSDAAKHFGTTLPAIINACKGKNRTACGYHMKYEGTDDPPDIEIGRYDFVKKRVALIETGKVYESIQEASNELGIKTELIINVCKGKTESTHGLHFAYANVHAKKETALAYKRVKEPSQGRSRPIICLETKTRYESIIGASKETGIDRKGLSRACETPNAKAGGYHWAYAPEDKGVVL